MEKMPSASNSPMMGRKVSSEDVNSKRGQPLSVASMVRRFERDNGLDKNRGGELERSNSSLNKNALVKESRSSSRTSSVSSSQGHLASNSEAVGSQQNETVTSPVSPTTTADEKEENKPSADAVTDKSAVEASAVASPAPAVSERKESEVNKTSKASSSKKVSSIAANTTKTPANRTVRHENFIKYRYLVKKHGCIVSFAKKLLEQML